VGTFKSKSGKAIFFNFGPDHKTCFTAVIFSSNIDKFKGKNGEDPVDYYLNKNVKLDGRVTVHDNRPEIILDDPKQLTVIGETKVEAEVKAEDIEKIKEYDGKLITVVGTIKRVNKAKSGKVTFINFGDDWKSSFTCIVFEGDVEKFKDAGGLESYLNKNVKLTGVVTIYKDKPEIILKSPNQITVQK
jgi:DNA/RNA endonuclease YhcR with UshA esterase domain